MKKSAGRPKVPKNKAKSPGISVRLTQNERKAIDNAIDASGLSQSEWARKALLSAAGGDKSAA
ncbi:MAG: plasmid mobilization protein [Limisphaerales bacterium]